MIVLHKRKIAAVLCTALLATAGIYNYIQSNNTKPVSLTNTENLEEKYDQSINYGEAKYVNSSENLELDKSRSEAVALLKTIAEDKTAQMPEKAEAQQEIMRIAKDIEKESVILNILKAKDIPVIKVFMNAPNATVSVKSAGLSQSDIAKIRDIVKTEGNIAPQNLKIIEIK